VAGPRVGDAVIKTGGRWKRNYEMINLPVAVRIDPSQRKRAHGNPRAHGEFFKEFGFV
jgi:hypothetical protein